MSSSPSAPPPSSGKPAAVRLIELDGLRGLAAVVVLIHHALETVPALAEVGARPGTVPTGTFNRILTQSPLHLLWAGHEAVLIFFVLSGVALTYPVARRHAQGRRFDWVDYAPRRFVRLWLPAAASTTFAVIAMLLVPRSEDPALGHWMTVTHPVGLGARQMLMEYLLIPKHAYRNTVLWSLHAEAIFSFVLPLMILGVALCARWRFSWLPVVAALAVPVITASPGSGSYLPVFTIGAVMGWAWGHNPAPVPERPRPWATAQALVCLLLITLAWWPGMESHTAQRLANAVTLAAAAYLVYLVVRAGALRGLLRSRTVQYLGLMSFSLYLVHEPVVVSLRLLTHSISPWWVLILLSPVALLGLHLVEGLAIVPQGLLAQPMSPWWVLILAPVVSAPLTWLFQRYIEAPSHRLARRTGALASARFAQWSERRRPTRPADHSERG
ncbi:acyltransferase family protein [Actinomyces oris]|uniref:acyltransferase family protein n=2 Tax=Actinomyces oris TaxID=544580 RepID=UPI0020BE51B4|nr:acyltransferase [Actinomyces oris]